MFYIGAHQSLDMVAALGLYFFLLFSTGGPASNTLSVLERLLLSMEEQWSPPWRASLSTWGVHSLHGICMPE